jgi:hypothetical protein
MRRALLAGLAIVTCACQVPRPDPVREYIRLAVALGERDPQSLDYYYGPAEWVGGIKKNPPSFAEIAKEAQQLSATVGQGFLKEQIRAVGVRASMLAGKRLPFDEEAAQLFGLTHRPRVNESKMERVRSEIATMLPGAGSLAARYYAFEARLIVPENHMRAVMDAAVKECRARTIAHLMLPADEGVETGWVHDKPWSAFSLYQGGSHSRVQWNADFGLTVDRALQLACHETYPGHHVHSLLIDQTLVKKAGRLEFMVQPTFSPQSFLSESLASYAAELAFTPEEREQFQRDVLYPIARIDPAQATREFKIARLMEEVELSQVDIARDFIDRRLEFTRAAEKLEQEALMSHAEGTLKYLNQYRSYMLGYTAGKTLARLCFEQSSDRWQLLRQLLFQETSLMSCVGWGTAIRQIR